MKNIWIFRSKTTEIMEKALPETTFLSRALLNGLGEGLGRVLERFWAEGHSWRPVGHFLALFFGACIQNPTYLNSKRVLGDSWARFWLVLDGFGMGLGKVSGGF